jgi:hypothetical protein
MNMPCLAQPKPYEPRLRYCPRRDVLNETLAGLLWMALALPEDATLEEFVSLADMLAQKISGGAKQPDILVWLQDVQNALQTYPNGTGALLELSGRILEVAGALEPRNLSTALTKS